MKGHRRWNTAGEYGARLRPWARGGTNTMAEWKLPSLKAVAVRMFQTKGRV